MSNHPSQNVVETPYSKRISALESAVFSLQSELVHQSNERKRQCEDLERWARGLCYATWKVMTPLYKVHPEQIEVMLERFPELLKHDKTLRGRSQYKFDLEPVLFLMRYIGAELGHVQKNGKSLLPEISPALHRRVLKAQKASGNSPSPRKRSLKKAGCV